jgi:hypothetical protein
MELLVTTKHTKYTKGFLQEETVSGHPKPAS